MPAHSRNPTRCHSGSSLCFVSLLVVAAIALWFPIQDTGAISAASLLSRAAQNGYIFTGADESLAFIDAMQNDNHARPAGADDVAPMMCSLWLVPPADVASNVQRGIDALAKAGNGPSFPAHVTIVGTVPCRTQSQIDDLLQTLQQGLSGFGPVACRFDEDPSSSPGTWNQALFFVMKTSPAFLSLCNKCRQLMGMQTQSWQFAPPIYKPHLSLFYGDDASIPSSDKVAPIAPFEATRIELWNTNPRTAAGVEQWRLVGKVDLS